jgi:dTDP-glucose 4,6-dehydratase/UDP-glucose 4-epimerase
MVTPWLQLLHPGCRVVVMQSDIRRLEVLSHPPTHVIHGATTSAYETSSGATPIQKYETVVDGTRALTRALGRESAVNSVYLSSGIAYGSQSELPLHESQCYAPSVLDTAAALGHAKRAAEFLFSCHAEESGSRLTIARCFSFCGPGMPLDLHYAIGSFIRQALSSEEIIISGDGRASRSYMHLGDLAIWILAMLTRPSVTQGTRLFNVGSDQEVTIHALAEIVGNALQSRSKVRVNGNCSLNVSGNRNSRYVPCIEKARNELGLEVWTPLAESIRQAAAYELQTT